MIPLDIKIYGYYKRNSGKSDYKAVGPVFLVKGCVQGLMKDEDISVIVIENPANKHRFKWDATADRKWREIGKPQDPAIERMRREFQASVNKTSAFKTPVITGDKVVIKVGGQVVAMADNASFTMNKK